jgi:branched-chain amino acid transport system ATP-binding protein
VEENPTAALRPGRWDVAAANRRFPRLAERRHNMRDHLSDGEQQLLADQASLVRPIGLNLSAPTG